MKTIKKNKLKWWSSVINLWLEIKWDRINYVLPLSIPFERGHWPINRILMYVLHNNSFWLSENDSYQFWVAQAIRPQMRNDKLGKLGWHNHVIFNSNIAGRWYWFACSPCKPDVRIDFKLRIHKIMFRVEDNRQSINHILFFCALCRVAGWIWKISLTW